MSRPCGHGITAHMSSKADEKFTQKLIQSIKAVIETVHRLRAPGGCPWDRAQTHLTLRPYMIEEAHEAVEALDRVESAESLRDERISGPLQEELGDVLMQVLLH